MSKHKVIKQTKPKYQQIQNHKILFCVLNWGLGHASRSIPIIKSLIENGNDVTLASDGIALELLQREFTNQQFLELPAYDIRYVFQSVALSVFVQTPKIKRAIKAEQNLLSKYIKEHKPDLVISDNRFGCYSSDCKSIFITHQLQLIHPFGLIAFAGTQQNKKWVRNFDEVWVPDYPDSRLSGKMSQLDLNIPKIFIGPLSRFEKLNVKKEYDIAVVLSGPEPSRSKFEKALIKQIEKSKLKCWMARGTDKALELTVSDNLEIVNLATSEQINRKICSSKLVICRAGYSSIMDLDLIDIPVLMVPTPGQTEQEYLMEHLKNKPNWTFQKQNNLHIERALDHWIE